MIKHWRTWRRRQKNFLKVHMQGGASLDALELGESVVSIWLCAKSWIDIESFGARFVATDDEFENMRQVEPGPIRITAMKLRRGGISFNLDTDEADGSGGWLLQYGRCRPTCGESTVRVDVFVSVEPSLWEGGFLRFMCFARDHGCTYSYLPAALSMVEHHLPEDCVEPEGEE